MTESESSLSRDLADLLTVMSRLRDPDTGCTWDLRQTYQSIVPSTLEEAYEVVDAIERQDYQHLREELGDLLFQVVFHSQLASEEQRFAFGDVVADLAKKLIRRHPHVFPGGTLDSRRPLGDVPDEPAIARAWEEIKEEERMAKGAVGLLDDLPLALPATTRATKMQKRASRCGFDWSQVEDVIAQLQEELGELEDAIARQNADDMAEEAGDLLFSAVNVTRHLGLDAESVLREANRKFERRFRYIEKHLAAQGMSPETADTSQMEGLWRMAKEAGL
jgi:ATP diphosphatase